MLKILDRYIIKTFFGPFFFIFSVLFFIFIVNIIWVQLGQFMGKGLSYWQILKLLFYLGVNVISMVLPLTILLASIMSFGEFGERYELAAMKAAGIPLTRVMTPPGNFNSTCYYAVFSPIISSRIFRRKLKTCFSILPRQNRLSTLLRDSLSIRFPAIW
ncbi:LptF/LptG family permease [Chryseobacterium sp. 1B4]